MLILLENPNGYSLIQKIKKNKKKKKILKIYSIYQFQTRLESVLSNRKLIKGEVPANLKKFIKNNLISDDLLIVNDNRLKNALKKKLKKKILIIKKKGKLFRQIRENVEKLFEPFKFNSEKFKTLSLVHSIFCNKLKINGTKIDIMIIQAIRIFDELDKEINNYSMRLREWYSWHFPELSTLIQDNIIFAKIVSKMETRERLNNIDLSDLITKDVENQIKEISTVSLGVEIFFDDLIGILSLSGQIISFSNFRTLLQKYIKNRMYVIAPNLTAIIGEKIGARLIAQSGSLFNLSKQAASTIQILGAEKSLFKALKNKNFTPKYGIIYHAVLITSAPCFIRGKISRIISGKIAISARVDAFGEIKYGGSIGLRNKKKIEKRLRQFESFSLKKNFN